MWENTFFNGFLSRSRHWFLNGIGIIIILVSVFSLITARVVTLRNIHMHYYFIQTLKADRC